ncbi:MAG: tRNA (cytidine(34)-2'-O)-methyltransferase [Pelagibacteraceae bacterium]|tara:strand:- start:386 stop:835 length:450 start_codon:yes stop_codon:yes gene_type:complete
MIDIALYQPDIPQNTAAIIRLGACLRLKVHIIEPCSFSLEDKRFKRVVMDYDKFTKIFKYGNFLDFKEKNSKSRIILLTTKATKNYLNFKFKKNDILLFGRESAGVPESIHIDTKVKIKIPLQKKVRSLNVAMSVAIASSEAIRQLENK